MFYYNIYIRNRNEIFVLVNKSRSRLNEKRGGRTKKKKEISSILHEQGLASSPEEKDGAKQFYRGRIFVVHG